MQNITKRISVWAIVVALLLMVPFMAMQFNWQIPDPGSTSTDGVNWTLSDFVFAGILLFGAALTYEFSTRNITTPKRRLILGIIVFVVLAVIWVGAATGFGGTE
ncbi:hypothetical protein KW782_03685 [Candidatus Parcubacteria bacterium]|nr:hypothetical protein [Candidatus Parcubacteria bacterium]